MFKDRKNLLFLKVNRFCLGIDYDKVKGLLLL
jgi:hypothetical protein